MYVCSYVHIQNLKYNLSHNYYIEYYFLFLLGDPPCIDRPISNPNITEGTRRVNVGNPVIICPATDVIIDCNIVNGTLPITILWLCNNEVIDSSEVYTYSSNITITGAKDGDVIKCRANNSIGFDEANTTIQVQGNSFTIYVYIRMYIYVFVVVMVIIC